MNNTATKKILSLLMAAALTLGVFAVAPATANAVGIQGGMPGTITLGTASATPTIIGFGGRQWAVIGYDGVGETSVTDRLTLFLAGMSGIGSTQFSTADNNEYSGSALQTAMNTVATTIALSDKEKSLIVPTTLTGGSSPSAMDGMAGVDVNDALFWPLSVSEANRVNDTLRQFGGSWWLRSPGGIMRAAVVDNSGDMDWGFNEISRGCAVRPAFKLNLSAVLFTSDAVGGKSGPAGATLSAAQPPTGAVKLTAVDNVNLLLTVSDTTARTASQGGSVEVNYTAAGTAAANRYVSCVIKDNASEIKYYGKLAPANSGGGAAAINIPVDMPFGTYTVRLFNEEINGDNLTDFASTPVDIPLTVGPDNTAPTISALSPAHGAQNVTTGAALTITFDEAVTIDSGDIKIFKATDPVNPVYTVTSPGALGMINPRSGTSASYTITPSSVLDADTEYYVTIDSTFFKDAAGNDFAGIADGATWAFKTAAAPIAPILTLAPPADGTATEGEAFSKTLSVTYTGIGTLGYSATGLPLGLSMNTATGEISGTPDTNTSLSSPYTVQVGVTDGSLSAGDSFTLTVNSVYVPPYNGGGSSYTPPVVIWPVEVTVKPNFPTTARLTLTNPPDKNNALAYTITKEMVQQAFDKAKDKAKADGREDYGYALEFYFDTTKTINSLNISFAADALALLESAGMKETSVITKTFRFSFDLAAIKQLNSQSGGQPVMVTASRFSKLSDAARKLIGSRPAWDVTISFKKDGKTVNITSLGNGVATLSIQYAPGRNEAVGYLFGVYVDGVGNATRVPGSAYDSGSGSMILGAGHFSIYGVGYTAPAEKYTDIAAHWGKESIDYVIGRGLLSGASETTFAPDTSMTRGMLVTALGRLANVDTKLYTTNSFTDVKADSTFRPYIEWARSKGVVQGIGNGQFAPDRAVTREEIAVIFANFAKATGYALPVAREATAYADADRIGSTYKAVVTAMQQAGIMMGGNGNKFNPKASATRAEVATMLHRYIKLTIDPTTP